MLGLWVSQWPESQTRWLLYYNWLKSGWAWAGLAPYVFYFLSYTFPLMAVVFLMKFILIAAGETAYLGKFRSLIYTVLSAVFFGMSVGLFWQL